MTKIHRIASYLMIGTLVLSGSDAEALAKGIKTDHTTIQTLVEPIANTEITNAEEPIAGIILALDEIYQSNSTATAEITQYLASNEASTNEKLAFAQVTNYVNVRSKASEAADIIGKLYDNSAATIISKEDDWYQVKSGSVKGYVKAEFLVTGEKADKLAEKLGNRVAEVTTTTLKVRKKPAMDEEVLSLVAEGDNLKVLKELDGWTKVKYSADETGFISNDYVKIYTVYEEAVSIEEEQERLEEESVAANQTLAVSSQGNTSSRSSNNSSAAKSSQNNYIEADSSNSSSIGGSIASYAVQFQGNPYVWGGTSLTNGADCSGFTQSVFAHFGISIPRTSRTQATGGTRVSFDNLRQGDLIFYTRGGSINHVAIYIGSGRVISASSPSTGIRITSYNYRQPYKAVRYTN